MRTKRMLSVAAYGLLVYHSLVDLFRLVCARTTTAQEGRPRFLPNNKGGPLSRLARTTSARTATLLSPITTLQADGFACLQEQKESSKLPFLELLQEWNYLADFDAEAVAHTLEKLRPFHYERNWSSITADLQDLAEAISLDHRYFEGQENLAATEQQPRRVASASTAASASRGPTRGESQYHRRGQQQLQLSSRSSGPPAAHNTPMPHSPPGTNPHAHTTVVVEHVESESNNGLHRWTRHRMRATPVADDSRRRSTGPQLGVFARFNLASRNFICAPAGQNDGGRRRPRSSSRRGNCWDAIFTRAAAASTVGSSYLAARAQDESLSESSPRQDEDNEDAEDDGFFSSYSGATGDLLRNEFFRVVDSQDPVSGQMRVDVSTLFQPTSKDWIEVRRWLQTQRLASPKVRPGQFSFPTTGWREIFSHNTAGGAGEDATTRSRSARSGGASAVTMGADVVSAPHREGLAGYLSSQVEDEETLSFGTTREEQETGGTDRGEDTDIQPAHTRRSLLSRTPFYSGQRDRSGSTSSSSTSPFTSSPEAGIDNPGNTRAAVLEQYEQAVRQGSNSKDFASLLRTMIAETTYETEGLWDWDDARIRVFVIMHDNMFVVHLRHHTKMLHPSSSSGSLASRSSVTGGVELSNPLVEVGHRTSNVPAGLSVGDERASVEGEQSSSVDQPASLDQIDARNSSASAMDVDAGLPPDTNTSISRPPVDVNMNNTTTSTSVPRRATDGGSPGPSFDEYFTATACWRTDIRNRVSMSEREMMEYVMQPPRMGMPPPQGAMSRHPRTFVYEVLQVPLIKAGNGEDVGGCHHDCLGLPDADSLAELREDCGGHRYEASAAAVHG
ncbi:unnamed protein product [Amoebophrya sp. A25]|nr:unnamed protein product [Amoebophrya sp. A25]|eukprot:GSA25T00008778001.1